MIDYLIIGSGLYGVTFARRMADAGKRCAIIDKRGHIGGNVYTQRVRDIHMHMYGPHIFNTNSKKIWNYVNGFTKFNNYRHKVKSCYDSFLYSFPLNIKTLEELWNIPDDNKLLEMFESKRSEHKLNENLEEWAIAEVGEEVYRKFIYGYTKKQWGKEPRDLPSFIIKRIPVRNNRNDDYHDTIYSGIPIAGYTELVSEMIDDIPLYLEEDYFKNRDKWDLQAKFIVYTGAIDEFFNYEFGALEWRSLRFFHEFKEINQYQPVAQVNYPQDNVEWTRIIEHKHFTAVNSDYTVITKEYPQPYKMGEEKYYPVNDDKNNELYEKYKKLIPEKFIFGGRLAKYKYYNMDQVIGSALTKSEKILNI